MRSPPSQPREAEPPRRSDTRGPLHHDDLFSATALSAGPLGVSAGGTFYGPGDVIERYEYGDFGTPNPAYGQYYQSPIGNRFMFTGREWDPEVQMYHYRTRSMLPDWGRFTTRDSIGTWGDELNFGNPYTLVANDPFSWNDPFGLMAWYDEVFFSIVDFGAGIADNLTFGLTRGIRDLVTDDDGVNTRSSSYKGGQYAETAAELALAGGALKKLGQWVWKEGAEAAAKRKAKQELLEQNAKKGKELEDAAGIDPKKPRKSIKSETGTAERRFPDEVTDELIREVKNISRKLYLTKQLLDYHLHALRYGKKFLLIVGPDTKLSGPLQNLVDRGYILLQCAKP